MAVAQRNKAMKVLTMSTNTRANAELERPMEDHELKIVSGGGLSGIDALISVTQMKADNANNDALNGASKQTVSHWHAPWTWSAPLVR
jgi:hypothetical protein